VETSLAVGKHNIDFNAELGESKMKHKSLSMGDNTPDTFYLPTQVLFTYILYLPIIILIFLLDRIF